MSIRELAQEGNRAKQPSIFRDTMAENVKNLRTWHQQHHHATSWADCVRKCWDA